MKAVWLTEFGGPEVLVAADAPDPVPGPWQALIEVAFANITFVETMFRASGFGPFEKGLPMIPGNGVGGWVASVGVEAEERLIGKRVVASTGGSGGYAERAAAAGRLRPVIGQRFPLVRAADAHEAIESRATVGKTLLVT